MRENAFTTHRVPVWCILRKFVVVYGALPVLCIYIYTYKIFCGRCVHNFHIRLSRELRGGARETFENASVALRAPRAFRRRTLSRRRDCTPKHQVEVVVVVRAQESVPFNCAYNMIHII